MTNLNGKVLSPLISFDMIFDTELGLINFIKSYCIDDRFDMPTIKQMSDREILSLLCFREKSNPLSILPIETMDDIDEMYSALVARYKKEIIRSSPFTDFGYVAILMASSKFDGIKPSILVHDEHEEAKMKSVKDFKTTQIIHVNDMSVNGKAFDPYYFLSYTDLFDGKLPTSCVNNMVGKNIYIANKKYNTDYMKTGDLKQFDKNIFTTIDIWRKDRTEEK